jgi:hypothetical protein
MSATCLLGPYSTCQALTLALLTLTHCILPNHHNQAHACQLPCPAHSQQPRLMPSACCLAPADSYSLRFPTFACDFVDTSSLQAVLTEAAVELVNSVNPGLVSGTNVQSVK